MSTSWEKVYKSFFDKIERDVDFFTYYNISDEEAMDIAKTRARNYLIESVSKLTLSCSPDINFNDYDSETLLFADNLTNTEIDLLANLMREKYFERDMSRLKAFEVHFAPKDITVFSPANERKTFTDMFKDIVKENKILIREYMSRDRLTGKLKSINLSQYSE